MPKRSFAEMSCSLARALDVIGDRWTPLILRDIYLGIDTYEQLVTDLELPRALLAGRLDALVSDGVLVRERYSERPERHRYLLTEAGRDLVPVLVALTQWGDRWRSPEGPPILFRHECGAVLDARIACGDCGQEVIAASLTALPGPGGRAAAGTQLVAQRLLEAAGSQ
jgi:DNA-binding HxlR family transcriptional regulator